MTVADVPTPEPAAPPRRFAVTPAVEFGVLAVAVVVGVVSWRVIAGTSDVGELLSPQLVALLMTANLLPAVALLVLIGRRIAKRRASRTSIGGEGRLHVRLVAIFSVLAAVPVLLVAIFASLLFQTGVQFWGSDRARGMLENASALVRQNYQNEIDSVASETTTMSGDLARDLGVLPIDSPRFAQILFEQTFRRELAESMIFRKGEPDPLIVLNPYNQPLQAAITPDVIAKVDGGQPYAMIRYKDRIGALVPLDYGTGAYLYAARIFDGTLTTQIRRGDAILADYRALQSRSRSLQLRFNAILLAISLAIVGAAVFVALAVADRLVRPVGELVDAAQRVAGGDLTARVPEAKTRDEIGVLANAFNRMTSRLEGQTSALVEANAEAESRRALIEAVLSGVTAGVIAIGDDRAVRLVNSSALALIAPGGASLVGRALAEVAPDLDALLASGAREGVVQITASGEARTLAVKINRDEDGHVLTFDDITQQLLDQRRAAWSDVARRIAHEIKNPLTPIQLAAERLQRRYGKLAPEGDTVFGRLTDTIVRQVGDLRRMVDEFSSFARMPKPVFREESLVDLARQAVFLHEVAHPAIRFALVFQDPQPTLVCDRRQIGQALTNLVKNAVEAIESRVGDDLAVGEITVALTDDRGRSVGVQIADNGIGLPVERDRIVEPYMTTRGTGTGLGLAIVKKIVEEHFGAMLFTDRRGGGTVVTLAFDAGTLASLADPNAPDDAADPSPTMLTRNSP